MLLKDRCKPSMDIAGSPHRQSDAPLLQAPGLTPAPVTPSGDYVSSRFNYVVRQGRACMHEGLACGAGGRDHERLLGLW